MIKGFIPPGAIGARDKVVHPKAIADKVGPLRSYHLFYVFVAIMYSFNGAKVARRVRGNIDVW